MDDREKLTAIERLEQLLNEKDAEIADISEQLEGAERRAAYNHTWSMHREYEKTPPPSPGLPVPRLEIRWLELKHPAEGYVTEARYDLVYRHLLGHVVHVPLGQTRSSGALAKCVTRGLVDLPFRDGAHFGNEMRQLGLRGFAIVGDVEQEVFICPRCGRLSAHHEGDWRACTEAPLQDWRPL